MRCQYGIFYDDREKEKDDEFMYGFLMAQEFNQMEKDAIKREEERKKPIDYSNDYEGNIKYYERHCENHKKHNVFLDILLISATGGVWFIWMIIRHFKDLKE